MFAHYLSIQTASDILNILNSNNYNENYIFECFYRESMIFFLVQTQLDVFKLGFKMSTESTNIDI